MLCLSYSVCNAQSPDPTAQVTGNLITDSWTGTTPASGYQGFSGGHVPGYIAGQQAIVFGYNQGTASQRIAIDAALSAAGTGVEVKGYTYSWYFYNSDMNRGNLTGNIALRNSQGATLESYTYSMPQQTVQNWHQMTGSQLFTNPYQVGQGATLDVSFTGKDDRWWAGYYGPAVKNINVRMMYGVNPCATNPAYSPECAGFNTVVTSSNLVPNPGGYAVFGNSIDQSFAVNQALSLAGTGVQIHGFQWGYVANANGPYCATWAIVCWDLRVPNVTTNVNITDNTGASIYSVTRSYQDSYNTTNYSFIFPSSRNLSAVGNFNFSATTNDQAYVGSMWSRALYTPDPCADPLSSPTCPGYGAAYAARYATNNTTTSTYTPTVTTSSTTSTVASSDPTQSAVTSTNVGGVEMSSGGTVSVPDGVPQVVKESQPAATAAAPAPATASNSTSSSSSGGSGRPGALVMNAIKAVQEQNRATEQRAVANAQAAVSASIAQSQETAATAIANINSASALSAQSSTPATQQQASSGQGFVLNRPTSLSSLQLQSATSIDNRIVGPAYQPETNQYSASSVGQTPTKQTAPSLGISTSRVDPSPAAPVYRFEQRNVESETQVAISLPSAPSKTDPLTTLMQQGNTFQAPTFEQRSTTVRPNVEPNELAGGVDIARMATVPVGFASYSFTLADSAFYAPKEIYRNQKVVDNARALRQMSSDRLHQQMINSQYKQEEPK